MNSFGSTLTDLMTGINNAQAIDYQRANAQDAVSAQRFAALLQAQNEAAQQRERSALTREQFQNNIDVAKLRPADYRAAQTAQELAALEKQKQDKIAFGVLLSKRRIDALNELKKIAPGAGWLWNDRGYNQRKAELDAAIRSMDALAAQEGMAVGPDGGYVFQGAVIPPDANDKAGVPPLGGVAPYPGRPVRTPGSPDVIPPASSSFDLGSFLGRYLGPGASGPAPATGGDPSGLSTFFNLFRGSTPAATIPPPAMFTVPAPTNRWDYIGNGQAVRLP